MTTLIEDLLPASYYSGSLLGLQVHYYIDGLTGTQFIPHQIIRNSIVLPHLSYLFQLLIVWYFSFTKARILALIIAVSLVEAIDYWLDWINKSTFTLSLKYQRVSGWPTRITTISRHVSPKHGQYLNWAGHRTQFNHIALVFDDICVGTPYENLATYLGYHLLRRNVGDVSG